MSIGNFDGVHVGHRAILARARVLAGELDASVTVMTFDPPPAKVLRPGSESPKLMDIDERVAALREAGAAEVLVVAPTRELLGLTAEDFLHHFVTEHNVVGFAEGADFRFGKGRGGDVKVLRSVGDQMGFRTAVVEPVRVALSDLLIAPVSSSLVRWLLAHGRVADAARVLGKPYALSTTVVKGEQRGRTIGVPTANLDREALADRVLPADGVYAGWVELDDGSIHPAAVSIGFKPTFGQVHRTIEAHLPGFAGDLYDRRITIRFVRWLRDQQPFPGVETLKAQLGRDIAQTRRWHALGLLDEAAAAAPTAPAPNAPAAGPITPAAAATPNAPTTT
jgi:riboflavin kinase / FMN adenylyltransferase